VKLLQTIASNVGFREPEHNGVRFDMLAQLLVIAEEKRADLVMLPGGYLTATSVAEVPGLIAEVQLRAVAADVAVIGGVDVVVSSHDPKRTGKTAAVPDLPFYGFAVGPVSPVVAGTEWKQTSSTGDNAAEVPDEAVPGENRIVDVAGWKVGVLICGELFSRWARESFAGAYLKLALDLGHESMGTGVTKAMENIAGNGGCAVAHTHHVAPHSGGSLHFVRADGVRESVAISECDWRGEEQGFWIAWRVREV
jgi:hypothetical protein